MNPAARLDTPRREKYTSLVSPMRRFSAIFNRGTRKENIHMTIKAVLFDLDGTLLPMDAETFTKGYFGLLAAKAAPLGYEPKKLIDAIWSGTAAMVRNDGKETNETVFWNKFTEVYGPGPRDDRAVFTEFYRVDFQRAIEYCAPTEKAVSLVREVKALGFRTILATNPIFPAIATESRIRWADLEPSDFEFFTAFETSRFCKPNPKYYREVLDRAGLEPENCLMVGNDATEDMAARSIGVKVFLLTNNLVNKEGRDIAAFPNGGFDQLLKFIRRIND